MPSIDVQRDEALAEFYEATKIRPAWDPTIGFAISAALGERYLHQSRVHTGAVANKGARALIAPDLSRGMAGWDFGVAVKNLVRSGLTRGPVKAAAQEVLCNVFIPLTRGGALPEPRRGYHNDPAELRFTILLTYMWRHLRRPALTPQLLYQLAFGLGIAAKTSSWKPAWDNHLRAARDALFTFDPHSPPPTNVDENVVDLYAAISDMTYHPKLQRTVCWRPDHLELVDYILRTQPLFDAVAYGRNMDQSLIVPRYCAEQRWQRDQWIKRAHVPAPAPAFVLLDGNGSHRRAQWPQRRISCVTVTPTSR